MTERLLGRGNAGPRTSSARAGAGARRHGQRRGLEVADHRDERERGDQESAERDPDRCGHWVPPRRSAPWTNCADPPTPRTPPIAPPIASPHSPSPRPIRIPPPAARSDGDERAEPAGRERARAEHAERDAQAHRQADPVPATHAASVCADRPVGTRGLTPARGRRDHFQRSLAVLKTSRGLTPVFASGAFEPADHRQPELRRAGAVDHTVVERDRHVADLPHATSPSRTTGRSAMRPILRMPTSG